MNFQLVYRYINFQVCQKMKICFKKNKTKQNDQNKTVKKSVSCGVS